MGPVSVGSTVDEQEWVIPRQSCPVEALPWGRCPLSASRAIATECGWCSCGSAFIQVSERVLCSLHSQCVAIRVSSPGLPTREPPRLGGRSPWSPRSDGDVRKLRWTSWGLVVCQNAEASGSPCRNRDLSFELGSVDAGCSFFFFFFFSYFF